METNINKRGSGLTETQKRFAEEYVIDYNGVEAYLRASPTCTNRSSAGTMSYKLLRNPRVIEYIHVLQKEGFDALCVNYERIAKEISKLAFANEGVSNAHAYILKLNSVYCYSLKHRKIARLD